MVQSLRQYIFVYRALMEYAQFGDTEVEIAHLRDHYRQLKEQKFEGNINGVMAEFEVRELHAKWRRRVVLLIVAADGSLSFFAFAPSCLAI